MKTLSVFVAVAIVLTVMCSQQSSAVPVLQVTSPAEFSYRHVRICCINVDNLPSGLQGEEQKRAAKCQFCCKNGHCGFCCDF
uniref:Hepcidin n=1 Tax=Gouania willdenowi TaxID=441366 RepID=A0A8C5E3J2_GOUWI